jgi:hypothetical protein
MPYLINLRRAKVRSVAVYLVENFSDSSQPTT